jgi:uncharacterized coiled-coil protein SlyX
MNEKKTLTHEEMRQLESYGHSINLTDARIENLKIRNALIDQTIENMKLQIKNLQYEMHNKKGEIDRLRANVTSMHDSRRDYAAQLASKYNVELEKFGYDDLTGEILDYDEEIENETETETNKGS